MFRFSRARSWHYDCEVIFHGCETEKASRVTNIKTSFDVVSPHKSQTNQMKLWISRKRMEEIGTTSSMWA
jgi:hypothetical protein